MEQRLLVDDDSEVVYIDYRDESMMKDIQNLVSGDLSEPYSIFTYRYFLHNYPELCICAYKTRSLVEPLDVGIDKVMIATIVCKLERESSGQLQGYMAMLAVDKSYRNRGNVFLRRMNMMMQVLIMMVIEECCAVQALFMKYV